MGVKGGGAWTRLILAKQHQFANFKKGIRAYLWNNPFGRALLMAVIKKGRPWLANCRFAAVRAQ
ncbi:MAG: hypothetical protein Q8P76_04255 [bacterium]|nr:hypothetical protein [bacterium]